MILSKSEKKDGKGSINIYLEELILQKLFQILDICPNTKIVFYYYNCNPKLETTRKIKKSYNSKLFQKGDCLSSETLLYTYLNVFRTNLGMGSFHLHSR